MTLAEIEKLAREHVRLEDTILAPDDNRAVIAWFVLRVLPVIRAAEAWDASHSDEKSIALCQALDAFRGGDK